VIVGISRRKGSTRRLFSLADDGSVIERSVGHINAYLVPAQDIYIDKATSSKSGLPEMQSGSKMTDGSNLVFTRDEVDSIIQEFPEASRFFNKIVGGEDLITGQFRWTVWVEDADAEIAMSIPPLMERFDAVRRMRSASTKVTTKDLASYPYRFDERRFYKERFIAIPQTSSEKREWLSCNYFESDVILIAPHLFLPTDKLWNMAIVASRLHLVWIASICGKLETRYRYSNTMGWNTFPVPQLTEKNKEDLARTAGDILIAREAHFPLTIADLYEPESMPEDLKSAHERNDEVLERIYVGRRFRNDTERLEKLFELYGKLNLKVISSKNKADSE
jgi:hypothetical protein